MEHDELIAELADVVRGPIVLLAEELRSTVAVYRQVETEAKADMAESRTVAKLHAAELRAAAAKGAGDAVQMIVRVLDGATRKGR